MDKKYNNIFSKKIDENKEILIESFVEYYGEEYRIKITNSINSIIFAWFRHRFLDELYKKYSRELQNAKDIKYFLSYAINEVIGSNCDMNDERKNAIKRELSNSPLVLASNLTFFNSNDFIEVVTFPIFITTDRVLFHEINHVVVRENMFYIDDALVRKDGLDVDTKYEIIEEIINELSARDITNIFHKMGGNIFDSKIRIGNDYEKLFPIVEPFYDKYKNILKSARISLNHNELFKYIDKDIYDKYVNLVNKAFYIKRKYDKQHKRFVIGKKVIEVAINYVNEMEIKDNKKLKLV